MSLAEIYQQDCEIQGWQPDTNHQIVLQHIQQIFCPPRSFFTSLFQPSPLLGCYIWGDVGRGKTYLMDLFFNNTPLHKKGRYHFTSFMQKIHQLLSQKKGDILAVAKQLRKDHDLICLDEFQVTEIADAMILARLFESLFAQGIHFVTTSNIKPDDLYKDGLHFDRFSPFIKVLKNNLDVIHLESQNSKDYRRLELESVHTFNIKTYADLREQFLKKINIQGKSGLTLSILQRTIQFPDASPTTLWVDFKDICEVPYGAAEYQAIAHQVNEVYLVNVPLMTADNRDSARRFITLIDCLYDEGITLYLHAAEGPDKLYHDPTKSPLPFERTASRLAQMETQHWK
ncbi:cell division protein ZapE [Candidatus Odyssella acanthamoebae]|uniref:cell division protein ZapE n=1 Tax=Candidatus Odyssella acanthamoebae TaxID=91604 RepID=UPI00068D13DF|nr:cell division protein ZapE [Candidatus Paracaedibacter acanthamoebae]